MLVPPWARNHNPPHPSHTFSCTRKYTINSPRQSETPRFICDRFLFSAGDGKVRHSQHSRGAAVRLESFRIGGIIRCAQIMGSAFHLVSHRAKPRSIPVTFIVCESMTAIGSARAV